MEGENKPKERERVLFVCYYESSKKVITRAFIHSMEELSGILAAFHRYYHSRGIITDDYDEWAKDVSFCREALWEPPSWRQRLFNCCARQKIKNE